MANRVLVRPYIDVIDPEVSVVNEFYNVYDDYYGDPDKPKVFRIKDVPTKHIVAITHDAGQREGVALLKRHKFEKIARFKGNYGSHLTLWYRKIKGRKGKAKVPRFRAAGMVPACCGASFGDFANNLPLNIRFSKRDLPEYTRIGNSPILYKIDSDFKLRT